MNHLVVYDAAGKIIAGPMSGSLEEPKGIPFMWLEIPQNKRLIKIDTTKNPHKPVFEDITPTEIELLKQDIAGLQTENTVQQDMNIMLLEAMADVYEEVLPFLPTRK